MKKLLALFLALTMVFTMAVTASASEANQTPGSTTLTTTVPAASYTLNIPADQQISFGTAHRLIGGLSVTESDGFALGKNLKVCATYTAFTCPDVSTTIPFKLKLSTEDHVSDKNVVWGEETNVYFKGQSDDTVTEYPYVNEDTQWSEYLYVNISSTDWGKALAGNYTATIAFTAEVVVE